MGSVSVIITVFISGSRHNSRGRSCVDNIFFLKVTSALGELIVEVNYYLFLCLTFSYTLSTVA